MSDHQTLAELSEASGIPARTIRFYIARGLLPGPVKAGRGAEYGAGHLARLDEIKRLQAQGKTLVEIGLSLDEPDAPTIQAPAAWWQFAVTDDVSVWVRGETNPWRMKQIRAAIEELAARVRALDQSEERTNHE